jgi:hypothetical protein
MKNMEEFNISVLKSKKKHQKSKGSLNFIRYNIYDLNTNPFDGLFYFFIIENNLSSI